MKSRSSRPTSRKAAQAGTSGAGSSDDTGSSSESSPVQDARPKASPPTLQTSDSGSSASAGRRSAGSRSPTQIGGLLRTLSSVRPSDSSKKAESRSTQTASSTSKNGKSFGKDSVPAVTPQSSSKQASRIRKPSGTDVADLKEAFQQKLYNVLMEPKTIQALRDLLRVKDKDLRKQAWALMLNHVLPIQKDGSEGPAKIVLNMNVPRPEQNVTPVEG